MEASSGIDSSVAKSPLVNENAVIRHFVNYFEPLIQNLDKNVENLRMSQCDLTQQIKHLLAKISKIYEDEKKKLDLEEYTKRLIIAKKKLNSVQATIISVQTDQTHPSSSSKVYQDQDSQKKTVVLDDYEGSEFEYAHDQSPTRTTTSQVPVKKASTTTQNADNQAVSSGIPSKSYFNEAQSKAEGQVRAFHYMSMNAYSKHKKLCNDYIRYYGGGKSFSEVFKRDKSSDKNDLDVIREQIKFVWEDTDLPDSWEKRLAKRYYDKLFKEYCLCDLTFYRQNKIAMRWRVEKEVIEGKGQFICGNKPCQNRNGLKSWEVNFAYTEHSERKNALVKIRLCPDCSIKLNYHHQKKEVVRKKKIAGTNGEELAVSTKRKSHETLVASSSDSDSDSKDAREKKKKTKKHKTSVEPEVIVQGQSCSLSEEKEGNMIIIQSSNEQWKNTAEDSTIDFKTREDIFETYLEDLLL